MDVEHERELGGGGKGAWRARQDRPGYGGVHGVDSVDMQVREGRATGRDDSEGAISRLRIGAGSTGVRPNARAARNSRGRVIS